MSYLGYSNLDTLQNKETWANDIALAALSDRSFYNFGELVMCV